jgi:hypothetical protein
MSATTEHRGAQYASNRIHIRLANELGMPVPVTAERHKARKLALLACRIRWLAADDEIGGLSVVAIINEEAAKIMKGYRK